MKALAPAPVHYRLAPGGGLLLALVILLVALGVVLLAWLLALRQAQQTGALLWWAVAVAYGGACVWSWRTARALPSGWLVWNGKLWQLQSQAQAQAQQAWAGQASVKRAVQTSSEHTLGVESCWLEAPAEPVTPYAECTLVLDMQRAVLLRLQAPLVPSSERGMGRRTSRSRWMDWFNSAGAEGAVAPAVWVWASRASDPTHWHALRCALVWAQTQGPLESDRAAGGPPAPAARMAEAGPVSQMAPVAGASTTQSGYADGGEAALAESATVSAGVAAPGQHRGAP